MIGFWAFTNRHNRCAALLAQVVDDRRGKTDRQFDRCAVVEVTLGGAPGIEQENYVLILLAFKLSHHEPSRAAEVRQ